MSSFLGVSVWFLLVLHYVAAVMDCHPGCRCEVESFGLFHSFSLTRVDCSGVGRGHGLVVPISIPLDTSSLDLSSSAIHTIADSMLSGPGYTTLASLDLSNNLLSRLNSSIFSRLRYLETLDLSHNTLEELAPGCFSGLPLAEVDLSGNRLQEVNLEVFSNKGHGAGPLNVDLSNNLLNTVTTRDPQVLSPPNIQSLSLAGNRLRAVPKLQGLPLRSLSLDGNPILSIERHSFTGLRDLAYLSLSGLSELTSIQLQSFSELSSLQVLDLSHNSRLRPLNPEVFSGLAALQELNLSNSGVVSLPSNILHLLPSIKSIVLREKVNCWKTHRQVQFHRQIVGQSTRGEKLTCDVIGIVL
ncbi:tsukushi-like [Oncorhynchus masou masou]|uniref:tsukushi-like n=1 Tax=Oncorhynchus masou masou TaxID=90313 RepID=UPI003183F746